MKRMRGQWQHLENKTLRRRLFSLPRYVSRFAAAKTAMVTTGPQTGAAAPALSPGTVDPGVVPVDIWQLNGWDIDRNRIKREHCDPAVRAVSSSATGCCLCPGFSLAFTS